MARWIVFLLNLIGWKRGVLAFVAGALAPLAIAPLHLWPLLIPSLSTLFILSTRAETPRAAFRIAWIWGWGYCLAGLHWMVVPLWDFREQFGWLIPFEIVGIHGGLALFYALAMAMYVRIRQPRADVNALLFTLCFAGVEWLRGHLLTGFPWVLVGYAWGACDASAQIASVMNIYLLTACTVALSVLPCLWWMHGRLKALAFVPVLWVSLFVAWGAHRLSAKEDMPTAQSLTVRLVQANIPQQLKWHPDHVEQSLRKHIDLSVQASDKVPDIIIWPETAVPFVIEADSPWPARLASMLKPSQVLITGAVMGEGRGTDWRVYNSILSINAKGQIASRYDKHHLVPFGEYVPLREWLPVEKITAGSTDFSAGAAPAPLAVHPNAMPVLPLICYEVIFPQYAHEIARGGWLLNLTNDAWFGNSFEPHQHLEMARFRAIEQGVPMVRVANTGISAAFDGYGRSLGQISLGMEGVLDVAVPIAQHRNNTH